MVLIAIMLAVFAILLIQVLRLLQERQPLPSLSSLGRVMGRIGIHY